MMLVRETSLQVLLSLLIIKVNTPTLSFKLFAGIFLLIQSTSVNTKIVTSMLHPIMIACKGTNHFGDPRFSYHFSFKVINT